MNTTFAELKQKVLRLIGDEPIVPGSGDTFLLYGAQTPADLLLDSVHAALDAICNRYPKSLTFSITDDSAFEVPADLIEVEGILKSDGTFMPSLQILAGSSATGNDENVWDVFTEGFITLQTALASDDSATVYYSATWAKPTSDSDALEPPQFLLTVLALYAAHYVLFYSAAQSGSLAQYKTKVDSGQPTDNPLLDLVNFFLKHYEIEMQRVPMKPKGRKS